MITITCIYFPRIFDTHAPHSVQTSETPANNHKRILYKKRRGGCCKDNGESRHKRLQILSIGGILQGNSVDQKSIRELRENSSKRN